MSKERFKLVAEVHLFLVRNGQVLMIRRFNTGFGDGQYSVPAGHMDGGEEVKAAALREAHEEVGVAVTPESLQVVGVMHRRSLHERVSERVSFFLAAEQWEGTPHNCEPDKCDDVAWHGLGNLPENTIPYVRRALENFQRGIVFDSLGWEG